MIEYWTRKLDGEYLLTNSISRFHWLIEISWAAFFVSEWLVAKSSPLTPDKICH